MPTFRYKTRDREGKLQEGIVKADNEEMAFSHLKEIGLTLVRLELQKRKDESNVILLKKNISRKDIAVFTRQLNTLIISGLSLVASLKALETSATNGRFKRILESIRNDIETGSSLSEAMFKHKKIFNELYCSMIKAGEESGRLAEVLDRLAIALVKEEQVNAKIRQAMNYPIILFVSLGLAIIVLGGFVIPRFAKLFSKLRVDLPLPTRILISVNYFITNYWFLTIILVVTFIVVFRWAISTRPGRHIWDSIKLKVYIFGPLFMKIYMARFSYLVATLIRSGLSVIDTFDLARQTANNVIISSTIETIREKVKHGRTIASAMSEEILFPELVIQMVRIGEESGRIDELLEQVSQFYEDEADHTINNLTVLIEPLLLGIIAGVVLVMALAIFLPLWNLHSAFSK
ncbi:MAG: type II secretion system F family protein [Candidatus Omnitrophica bacterium]|nr:type II secretion system F family protein [Candidatus Omnitrophota bacterium]